MPKDTTRKFNADEGMFVEMTCTDYGRVYGKLVTWRDKQGGGEETLEVQFSSLSTIQLECIGSTIMRVLNEKRYNEWDQGSHGIRRIQKLGEGRP